MHRLQNASLGLLCVIAFTVEATAQIYVVNNANGTIGKYSLTGEPINTSFISGLSNPTGLAVTGERMYVTQGNGVIKEFTTSGTLANNALISGLNAPWGIAVSEGYLYVANAGSESSTVGKYTTSGQAINPSLVSGLGNPTGVAVVGNDLYVSEWHNGSVGKYTTTGSSLRPVLASGLNYPGGMAVDELGNLYVSTLNEMHAFTSSGAVLGGFTPPTGYNSGIGLALTPGGQLLWANNFGGVGGDSIGAYSKTGQLLNGAFITGLSNPVAIVVVPEPSPLALVLIAGGLLCLQPFARKSSAPAS